MKPDVVLMVRDGTCLVPADARAEALVAKLAEGEAVAIRIARGRSLPQHNLLWSVLDHVAKATEWETPERLLVALKVQLGRYDLMKMANGKVVPVPHSISFSAMSQDDFQRFFDDALRLICEQVLGGMAVNDLIVEVCAATGTPLPERRVA